MNEHQTCTCAATQRGDYREMSSHYCNNFIPTGWKLAYESLHQKDPKRILYVTGWCLHCGGQDLQSGTSIPEELTGDALLEHIYRQMEHYRPFDRRFDDGAYHSRLPVRARWYMEQDDLKQDEKNAQFLLLFHEKDWSAVEDWLRRSHNEEPYTAPRRDRKSTLLYAVLDRARASGDLREIESILDYYLPSKKEPLSSEEDTYLTNYAFSAIADISFGCEGIFVNLSLAGDFDDSSKNQCSIGTFKTLRDDVEASRLMGQLCGVLMYHATKYVNENIHRYTPTRQLEAELRRKALPVKSSDEDSVHG